MPERSDTLGSGVRCPILEVRMTGGVRLFSAFLVLSWLGLLSAAVQSGDKSKPSSVAPSARVPDGPPLAESKPVAEFFHGARVIDSYRWLEKSESPETQKWVEEENAYTRALLDPLPGREAIHRRLTELLSIGIVTPPQIAGRYYFYTKREGMQNQPVLYVRENPHPKTQNAGNAGRAPFEDPHSSDDERTPSEGNPTGGEH